MLWFLRWLGGTDLLTSSGQAVSRLLLYLFTPPVSRTLHPRFGDGLWVHHLKSGGVRAVVVVGGRALTQRASTCRRIAVSRAHLPISESCCRPLSAFAALQTER